VALLSKDAFGSLSTGTLNLSGQGASFVAAGAAFFVDILVSLGVSAVTKPKPDSELRGLVYALTPKSDFHDETSRDTAWWQQPTKLAGVSLVLVIILNIVFW